MGRIRLSKEIKQKILSRHGYECIHCGSKENLEFHHVFPVELGCSDRWQNIVPMCYDCHKAITNYSLFTAGRSYKGTGRKRRIPSDYEDILWRYARCEIGKAESLRLLGLSPTNKLTDNVWYHEFVERNGIERIQNSIDMKTKKSGFIRQGDRVGKIMYKDGNIEYLTG